MALGFSFNTTNPAAIKAAQKQGARLVTNVSDSTRKAIRSVVVLSLRDGIPPLDAAGMIHDLIGMTERDAGAAMNFREALINQGHTPQRVQQLFRRFVKRKISERSKTIARTEIMGALNSGQLEAWKQARKTGFVEDGDLKEWITTFDSRTSPCCSPVDGQRRELDEQFSTPKGSVDRPPLHPRCRCTMSIVPKE